MASFGLHDHRGLPLRPIFFLKMAKYFAGMPKMAKYFTMTSGLSGKVDSTLTNPPPTVRNYDQKKTKIYSNTAYVVKFVLKI